LHTIQNGPPALNDSPPAIVHQISVAEIERHSVLPRPGTAESPLHELVARDTNESGHQELLFPQTPRSICEELGLDFWQAVKLYHEGWLSFSPESTANLDDAQQDELRFIGCLALAGCDHRMLSKLLEALPRPYAHHASKLYYDWNRRNWRVLPDPEAHPESTFNEWLERLVRKGDADALMGILELTHDALARVNAHPAQGPLRRTA
jgi:hypothetical protein